VASRLLTSLFLFVLLARLWGPEEFGLFSFIFSVATMVALLVDFGFQGYLLREIGAHSDRAGILVSEALSTKLVLLGLSFFIVFISLLCFRSSPGVWIALPLLLAAFSVSFSEFFISPLRALGRYELETGIVTTGNFMLFAVAGSAAYFGENSLEVAWLIASVRVLQFGISAFVCRNIVSDMVWRPSGFGISWGVAKKAFPYGFDSALVVAWNHIDVIVVRILYGDHVVGVYAAGQKIVQGACALAPIIGNVMIPRLAKEAKAENPKLIATSRTTTRLLFGMGGLFAIPILVFSGQIGSLVFGSSFAPLSGYLFFFGLVIVFRYLAAGYGVLVTAVGLQSKRVVAQVIAFCFFLVVVSIAWVFSLRIEFFLSGLVFCAITLAILYRLLWLKFRRIFLAKTFDGGVT
jgi:O-antigen/teichoic acid export membrane protein